MKITSSNIIKDLFILKDNLFKDDRGKYRQFFDLSSWVKEFSGDALFTFNPHQTSASLSKKGTMRGFHGDKVTKKLVSCPFGSLQLILIDVIKDSESFGCAESFTLSEEENVSILVPESCAVGHLILSERAMFHYLQSSSYGFHKQFTLTYRDPSVNNLFLEPPTIVSDRDKSGLLLEEIN